jgi:transglutaminase-like putative cysteine protease
MVRYLQVAAVFILILLYSCGPKHLINDRMFRTSVFSDFSEREKSFGKRIPELFSKIELEKDPVKREAMMYMAAYMPLNDFTDFSFSSLAGAIDVALRTRNEMPWGKDIPLDIFLDFVLPPRVNNENLDSFRVKYFRELSDRVKGMDEAEAALEINHWCHEKVTYQPSDIRTSSPLATILSARGRCGEESTFAVSALRTVGIPARQVYTPRWAHTDDNHAWVEVWVKGKWHYMGACEPEPVLDRGWFTEPARRAMLIHTKAFGNYRGDELVIKRNRYFAELNCLPAYAVTKELKVSVVNDNGEKVKQATVDFLLYNYAELYPIASVETDANGRCSFVTGMGDLVVWAHYGNEFGYSHISVSETDSLKIKIKDTHLSGLVSFDLKAPVALTPLPGPDPELIMKNSLRLSHEDSLRLAYTKSWKSEETIKNITGKLNLEESEVRYIINSSMGNYLSISDFLIRSGEKAPLAMRMLKNISEKDLRDADSNILLDHLLKSPARENGLNDKIYERYLLSPRIDNEKMSAWRSSLPEYLPAVLMERFSKNPEEIANWIDTAIVINETGNYYNVPLTPGAVAFLRISDRPSVKIFYVALCRTLGIPARIDTGTNRPQYYKDDQWNDAWFSGDARSSDEKAYITFASKDVSPIPEYYSHFTLARFENGRYRTLEFDFTSEINGMPHDIPVDAGRYMLFTGNRISDETVLADAFFFDMAPGEHKTAEVTLRHSGAQFEKTGEVSFNRTLTCSDNKTISLSSVSDKGIVGIWIIPGSEPTTHVFSDLPAYKDEFDKWGGSFIFFIDKTTTTTAFDPSKINGLPKHTLFVKDDGLKILKSIFPLLENGNAQMPVIFYADKNGNIYYFSEGYKIGTGDQIIKRIR